MQSPVIEEVTVAELIELQQNKQDVLVLDVREPSEYDVDNMGGKLIPLGQLPTRLDELNRDQLIVVHCKSGGRSSRAVAFLKGEGFKHVKNLKGGITAWREAVKK
jgi:rhodanese-related sulfurtransferase